MVPTERWVLLNAEAAGRESLAAPIQALAATLEAPTRGHSNLASGIPAGMLRTRRGGLGLSEASPWRREGTGVEDRTEQCGRGGSHAAFTWGCHHG